MQYEPWLYKGGIKYMTDIWNSSTGAMKSVEQLKISFKVNITFLDIGRISKAIPKEWVTIINSKLKIGSTMTGLSRLKDNVKCTKIVYDYLVEKKIDDKVNRLKWERDLNCEISDKNWEGIHCSTIKLTKCTKLRYFQYRITNRYLTTNMTVSKWANVDQKCGFCKDKVESIEHLFVNCIKVKKLWQALAKWLNYFCFIPFTVEPYPVIFNDYKCEYADMVNTIVLLTKHYIYVQKCYNEPLSFVGFIRKITQYKNMEIFNSKKHGNILKVQYKWCMFE